MTTNNRILASARDFVTVPREPTDAMLAAVEGFEVTFLIAEDVDEERRLSADDCAEIWRAMLAAAPTTPAPETDAVERVAKAIFDANVEKRVEGPNALKWASLEPRLRAPYLYDAKAAITALAATPVAQQGDVSILARQLQGAAYAAGFADAEQEFGEQATIADGKRSDAVDALREELVGAASFAAWKAAQPPEPVGQEGGFQQRVHAWLLDCFGEAIAADKVERIDRFTEEAMELAQALGYGRERAHALIDYVFDRPAGEPTQELGGVMVTLAALCPAHDLDMQAAAERELSRITTPEVIAKIRAKQATKPTGSALPVATSAPPPVEGCNCGTATPTYHAGSCPVAVSRWPNEPTTAPACGSIAGEGATRSDAGKAVTDDSEQLQRARERLLRLADFYERSAEGEGDISRSIYKSTASAIRKFADDALSTQQENDHGGE
jgi:NTP pyrophosphatase (non-canonical NTP hydrolase)